MDSRLGCNTPGEDEHMFYKEREKRSYLYSEMHEKLDLKHRRLFLLLHYTEKMVSKIYEL